MPPWTVDSKQQTNNIIVGREFIFFGNLTIFNKEREAQPRLGYKGASPIR